MIDGFYWFKIHLFLILWAICIATIDNCYFREDAMRVLRDGFDGWMQSEDGSVIFIYCINKLVYILKI